MSSNQRYFNRHVEQALLQWKHSPLRKPLLNYGARQVGKSSVIQKFGSEHYDTVIEINFMRETQAEGIFDDGLNPDKVLQNIQLYKGKSFAPDSDLIVFEEIGYSKVALTSLKFFAEEAPHIHVIATGSNVGLYRSFPVGKVDWVAMYPMNFAEFVEATGNNMLLSYLRVQQEHKIPEIAHQKLLDLMTDYWFVGGMPEAVEAWLAYPESQPLQRIKAVERVKKNLIKGYEQDFGKLSKDHEVSTLKLKRIYSSQAKQIASVEDGNTPKFKFKGTLGKTSVTYDDIVGPVDFLRDLMLVHKVNILEAVNQSYNMSFQFQENKFKLIPHDVGLLCSMIRMTYMDIKAGRDNYKGFLAEVFAANEMISAMEYEHPIELFCFRRDSGLEIEFVVENSQGYTPVEVKSGKATRSRSLSAFVERYSPRKAYKLSAKNVLNNPDRVVQHYSLYQARDLYLRALKT